MSRRAQQLDRLARTGHGLNPLAARYALGGNITPEVQLDLMLQAGVAIRRDGRITNETLRLIEQALPHLGDLSHRAASFNDACKAHGADGERALRAFVGLTYGADSVAEGVALVGSYEQAEYTTALDDKAAARDAAADRQAGRDATKQQPRPLSDAEQRRRLVEGLVVPEKAALARLPASAKREMLADAHESGIARFQQVRDNPEATSRDTVAAAFDLHWGEAEAQDALENADVDDALDEVGGVDPL